MTDDDNVSQALRALRETWPGTHSSPARARSQILARAALEQRRRRRMAFTVLPFAATFAASIAWGAITGRLSNWIDGNHHHETPKRAASQLTLPEKAAAPVVPTSRAPSEAPGPDTSEPPTPSQEGARLSKSAPSKPLGASSGAPSARARASATSSREQALYTAAHRAHFVDHNALSALSGWDTYLNEYPEGRFALEARYNRAISLVRLGRHAEAKRALTAFANGEFGGYRQSEAKELLEALQSTDGGT